MYEEAVTIFQKAVDIVEGKAQNFKHFKKNLIEKEAIIFNNIAACYK
jgi:hypothetical protein